MAPPISPAIVIGIGPTAENIIGRAQDLIKLRNRFGSLPPIFQFLTAEIRTSANQIARAYTTVTNKRTILITEESTGMKVMPSRVETYVIAPLHPDHHQLTIQVARKLKESSRETISGGRNAVFLIPKIASQLARDWRNSAAQIDAEIKNNLIFNRSFFVDEIDEFGQTIEEADRIELVARFISLAVASELSNSIRLTPPPYFGDGPHFIGYGSFSCSNIVFDRGRLIHSLSACLVDDIRQRLFADPGSNPDSDKWSAPAELWFADSLERPLGDPQNLEVSDLNLDKDFTLRKRELDDLTLKAGRLLFRDINGYRRLLDSFLKRGVIEIESHAAKIKQTRKEINELQIKIMLGIGLGTSAGKSTYTTTKRNWPLIALLGVLGLGGLIALVVMTNGQLLEQKLLTCLAIALMVVAVILLRGHTETHESPAPPPPISPWEEQLKKKKLLYKQQKKLENIHLALFTYLDLAHTNLEDLRTRSLTAKPASERNIFDVDFNSEQLTKIFYDQYETKEADIAAFTDGANLDQIHRILFSYFNSKLFDYLGEYCNQRFSKSNGYDLEKALHLSESISGHQPALAVSAPVWHPLRSDSEKVILAITSDDSNGMRSLIRKTFCDNKVEFFDTQDRCVTTLVQIAYGQELKNILNDPTPKTQP